MFGENTYGTTVGGMTLSALSLGGEVKHSNITILTELVQEIPSTAIEATEL